ncbi:MAG: metal ABC transporter permease [Endomicrobiaceae bacterium]|nr:metal ABC transporter permease [Endomicrobiaceae bacterium]
MIEFLDFFNFSFFNRALIMSVLCGISCGIIGVWILLLNIPFIGVTMAHSAFAGAIVGLVCGVNPILSGFIFCILSSFIIGPLSDKTKLNNNMSINLLFSLTIGVAFLLIGIQKDSNANILTFIWGSILMTSWLDIQISIVIIVLLLLFTFIFHKGILAVLFNREIARSCGIPERAIFYALLIFSGMIVSLNLHAVGGLLIYSLIALPSATAYQLTNKIKTMYVLSSVFSVGACLLGLFTSTIFNLPVSATIIVLSCVIFFVSIIFSKKHIDK